ncbi:hypothetical protein V1499_23040 (plasmid) [Neobacillus sp. SCS-31]|uniref:hypothetical protein n=1 Tax=Neobacillus oceani TaxID=3115292 RepID=UPI003906916F
MSKNDSSEITFTLGRMTLLVGGDQESVFFKINERGKEYEYNEKEYAVDLFPYDLEILITALTVFKKRIENNPCKGCNQEL